MYTSSNTIRKKNKKKIINVVILKRIDIHENNINKMFEGERDINA